MCKVLKVHRSGYYAWLKGRPSKRAIENRQLLEQIKQIHQESKKSYGSPRITATLRSQSVHVSRNRVARLMRKANIRAISKKKFIATTHSGHDYPVAKNLLNRNFKAGKPGTAWVSDITYIRTMEGWLYLTIVMDLADRMVIGWSTGKSLSANDTVLPAWKMARSVRPVVKSLIFHSDRGIQYASNEFRETISQQALVQQSMSRKGNCWDNAVAESFFKTLKTEWTNHQVYVTRKQAEISLFEYIETWYNTRRKHSSLNYMSPLEFGKQLVA